MLYLTLRMSNGGFIDNIGVMADHKIFDRMPVASTILMSTIILLSVLVTNIIKKRIIVSNQNIHSYERNT